VKRKWIISGIILVAIVGFIIIGFINKKTTSPSEIKTAKVTNQTFTKNVQSSGKTKAKKFADLKFQTSGKLAWINVKEGDHVTAGQAIAGLDAREVEKNLQKALTDYTKQRNDYEETWRVTYSGVQDPNSALTDTVKRILQNNQWDLNKAVYDVELSHLALEYATLISPISGIISHIDVATPGVNITPATASFEIVDPDSLVFEANIDETDVGKLEVGQTASIALDAFPDATFSAHVSYISFSSIISAGGATVFPVEVAFNEAQKIRIGLNGDVTIFAISIPDALTIPSDAIRESTNGKYVYKKVNNSYEKIPVKIGFANDTDTIIESGLNAQDDVVIKGFSSIPNNGK
jgi:RND family efflux transporter MFP subunit